MACSFTEMQLCQSTFSFLFFFSTEWNSWNLLIFSTAFLCEKGCNYHTRYYGKVQFPLVRHVIQLLKLTDNCAHVMRYIEIVQIETHTRTKKKWILEKLNKKFCAHKSHMILLWWNKVTTDQSRLISSLFTTYVWEYNQLIFHDSLHVSGNPLLAFVLH